MTGRRRYESLIAWQRADDLFIKLHRVSRQQFPADERYELASQRRRAALSVPANIVEGLARYHRGERLHFLRTSWASLSEAGDYRHVAKRLGYLSETLYTELIRELRQTAAPLLGLIRALGKQLKTRRASDPTKDRRLPRP